MMTSRAISVNEENKRVTADVVVVGGGPGGSAAAKKCAEYGMRTILLERHTLPRHITCSGMVISNMVHAIIAREFGNVDEILTDPPYLLGYQWHTSSSDATQDQLPLIKNVFRRDFDYWLNLKARDVGAEIWDGALVTDIIQDKDGIILRVRRFQQEQEIRAKFVVGADGAGSVIRIRLYPNLKIKYDSVFREWHPGALELDVRYKHFFGSARDEPTTDWFSITHKKDCVSIQCIGTIRLAREAMALAKQTLKKWGFDPNSKPLWSCGNRGRNLRDAVFSGKFIPAKGNVLLVGDAAGIFTPSERPNAGEGINTALKTGLLAANAIKKAADTSQEAAGIYMTEIKPVLDVCNKLLADISYYTKNWTERDKLLNTLV